MSAGFPSTSRYYQVATTERVAADGARTVHLRRRFVPAPDRFEALYELTVVQGDRLDNVTAQHLDDPEQFWRLCDANGAIRPTELTDTVGRRLRITLPEGVRGPR